MVGADRLGVRFAPLFESTEEDRVYIGLVEDDPHVTYIEAIKYLKKLGLPIYRLQKLIGIMHQNFLMIFVEMSEHFQWSDYLCRSIYGRRGTRILELADLIAFGPIYCESDLPDRIANGWPLNPVDASTMYGGTKKAILIIQLTQIEY